MVYNNKIYSIHYNESDKAYIDDLIEAVDANLITYEIK